MRELIIFIAVLLGAGYSFCQTVLWPKTDADWYYYKYSNGVESYINYSIDRDTLIQNMDCQVYARNEKTIDYIQNVERVITDRTARILSLADSVLYEYNRGLFQFDTIVNFKARIGDKWLGRSSFHCPFTNTFEVTVLNVTTETVSGQNLKCFDLRHRSLDESYEKEFKFYQLMGARLGIELVDFDNCNFSEAALTTTNCFLYNEGEIDSFSYHISETIIDAGCDYVPTLSTDVSVTLNEIVVVNPVKNSRLKLFSAQAVRELRVFNAVGKELQLNLVKEGEWMTATSTESFERGVYFCEIVFDSGKSLIKKVLFD